MDIQTAIKKAIEGGYYKELLGSKSVAWDIYAEGIRTWNVLDPETKSWDIPHINFDKIFLDPKFWQCLGKAMGWQLEREWEGTHWKKYWHRFIDHLAEGKTIEKYFEDLS